MSEFVRLAGTDEVQEGSAVVRTTEGGQRVAIFNVGGSFHAVSDACVHMGASLAGGDVCDGKVRCPLHGWQFDLGTGHNCMGMGDEVAVQTYAVKVEGGEILVSV